MGYMNEFPHTRMFDSDLREILSIFNSVMSLPNEFADLKNFVENYFKNLNVEEAINSKLDSMVADGTLQGILDNILSNIIFVENWGAVGDGVTDDTEAIKNAFANADGKVVIFKSNTYLVDSTFNITETSWWETYNVGIKLPSNAYIIGNGATLKMKPNGATGYFIINGRQAKNTIIENLNFLGDIDEHNYAPGTTSEWGCGLALFGCTDIEVRNCKFKNIIGDGIYIGHEFFYNANKTVNSRNIHVSNCVIDRAGRNGIAVCDGVGHTIENCEINNVNRVQPKSAIDLETEGDGFKIPVECVIRNLKSKGCFNGIINYISSKLIAENIEISLADNGYSSFSSYNITDVHIDNAILDKKVMLFGGSVEFNNVNNIDINILPEVQFVNFTLMNSNNVRIYKQNKETELANVKVVNSELKYGYVTGYFECFNTFVMENSKFIYNDVNNIATGAIKTLRFENCYIECTESQYLFTGDCEKMIFNNCDIVIKNMLLSITTNLRFKGNHLKTNGNTDAVCFLYGDRTSYIIGNVFETADGRACSYNESGRCYVANNVVIGNGTFGGSGAVVKNNTNMERS